MKHNIIKAWLIVLIALAFGFISCSSDLDDSNPAPLTTTLEAFYVGPENATPFSSYLAKRFLNRSTDFDENTKVIVVTEKLSNLKEDETKNIKTVFKNGGAVVVVDLNFNEIESSAEVLALVEEYEKEDSLRVGAIRGTGRCDAYIFNKEGNHLIVDTRDNNEGYSTDGDSKDEEGSITPELRTEADYSPIIDEVIRWINNPPKTGAETAGADNALRAARAASSDPQEELDKVSSAANYTRIFNISSSGHKYYDGSQMGGYAAITDTQYVWQCYSSTNNKDYYIVQDDIVIPNSGMYRGIWKHSHHGIHWKECGLYMTSMSVNSELLGEGGGLVPIGGTGSDGATIHDSEPKTENNVTTVTSGMSWNIGGNVSYNQTTGGGGRASGGVTFSKSTSYDIQDVSVVNQSDSESTPNAKFAYTTNKVSTYNTGHDRMRDPADLACNTAQFTHYWRWEVEKPKEHNGGANGGGNHTDNGRFGMRTEFNIQYEETAAWGGAGSTKRWYLNKQDASSNFTWWFPTITRN